MDTRLKNWVNTIAQTDRTLAALLRGLVGANTEGGVTEFVWHSAFHKEQAERKEGEIRKHLGPWADNTLTHRLLSEVAAEDPMLEEALALGARVTFLRD